MRAFKATASRKALLAFIGVGTLLLIAAIVLHTTDRQTIGNEPIVRKYQGSIVIDAGHGGFDGGASGDVTKIPEDGLNLSVALRLRDELETAGVNVTMTREDENALGPTKAQDMAQRRGIILESNAKLVISIHMNKYPDASCKGPAVFYMDGSMEGQKAASAIQSRLNEATGGKRKALTGNYFVLRAGERPCVIVECGFLSNPDEEQLLIREDYQAALARYIAAGVFDYLDVLTRN